MTTTGMAAQAALRTELPVEDAFLIDLPIQDGDAVARFEGAIHGVYRVPEGTVIYWSLREAEGTAAHFVRPEQGFTSLVVQIPGAKDSAPISPAGG